MSEESKTFVPTVEDYEGFLAFLKREPPPPHKGDFIIYEFHSTRREDVPPDVPACESNCWVAENGFFFRAEGALGIWESGNPSIEDCGEEFSLDPESIWHISRLCSVMKHPPMRAGVSRLRDFLVFLRGMEETLHFNFGDQLGVEELTYGTLLVLAKEMGENEVGNNFYLKLNATADDGELLRRWRDVFREELLFTHPEVGLSYAAYMGSRSLFGFETLLHKEWYWRRENEGANKWQRELREHESPQKGARE